MFNAPVVFFCQNNQWAISEPLERQSRVPLYQRASGFGFPGIRVDGNDVLACLAVTRKAMQAAREGQGPTLIEAFTYRMGAHTTTDDPTRYRLAAELEAWKLKDPIERVKAYLSRTGGADAAFFDAVDAEADEVGRRVRQALPGDARPAAAGDLRQRLRRADTRCSTRSASSSPPTWPPSRPRRWHDDQRITLSKALNEGLRKALEDDPKVLIMGEDVGKLGGVFRVTDGLQKDFGEHRVVDTPLAESGIVGTAIGLALRGYRPVCEIQFDGFVFPAFDQIVSQLAKMRLPLARPASSMPVVIRIPFGGGIGAVEHHSESPEAYFVAHRRAAGGRLRRPGGRLRDDPAGDRLRRPGDLLRAQAPVLGQGRGGHRRGPVRRAAADLGADRGRGHRRDRAQLRADGADLRGGGGRRRARTGTSLEVIDLRSLSPLDIEHRSSRRCARPARCVVVHEAPVTAGLGAEIAARVTEECFYHLEAPVLRVGGFSTPYPPSRLEEHYLPDLDRVLDAVDRAFAF